MIAVNSLAGVGRIPNHRTSASRWLRRHGVPTSWRSGKGGRIEVVSLADLPEPERRAYLERDLAACRLEPGAYDDAAHAAFAAAAPSLRAEAERRAAIVRLLLSVRERAGWPERLRLVRERFGAKAASKPTLKRYLKAVDGVDPINFAPALLPGYRPTARRAEMSEEAWRFFLTTLRDAGASFPLKAAWRDVRDVAEARGWAWPSYATVHRRWEALPEAQRLAARHGREEAARRLAQPALRDKTTLAPLEIVSLDGRTLDFWAALPDGAVRRPTMLALVDVASGFVIGWTLSASENAVATLRTIRGACERHGIMDRIYTDNGSAFAGPSRGRRQCPEVARHARGWRRRAPARHLRHSRHRPDLRPAGQRAGEDRRANLRHALPLHRRPARVPRRPCRTCAGRLSFRRSGTGAARRGRGGHPARGRAAQRRGRAPRAGRGRAVLSAGLRGRAAGPAGAPADAAPALAGRPRIQAGERGSARPGAGRGLDLRRAGDVSDA